MYVATPPMFLIGIPLLLPESALHAALPILSGAAGNTLCPAVYVMQATMVVADAKESLTITGNGDVVEPHDGVVGEPADSLISPAPGGEAPHCCLQAVVLCTCS